MEGRAGLLTGLDGPAVEVLNAEGRGDVVLVCEHASNRLPVALGTLGLSESQLRTHIAWDPGAAEVARHLSAALDAPLVLQRFSRLAYDCNRPPSAPDAMPARSEVHDVPGNAALAEADRRARIEAIYLPFHRAVADLLDRRAAAGRRSALVTVHSFTPVYAGVPRAVELGILHDADRRLADAMMRIGGRWDDLAVRRNAPYGPEDGVTHTLVEHALPRGLPNVMIEIRNDLIGTAAAQESMARRLAGLVAESLASLERAHG